MSSQAQLDANRNNALNSTGPRSAAGKAVSRFNALKHTLDAKEQVIPTEDPEARAELTAAYRQEHDPIGATESYLAETLAHNHWNRMRYQKVEAQVIRTIIADQEPSDNPLGAAFLKDSAGAKVLDKVYRRLDSSHRAWMKALAELRRIQKERRELEAQQPAPDSQRIRVAPQPQQPPSGDPTIAVLSYDPPPNRFD